MLAVMLILAALFGVSRTEASMDAGNESAADGACDDIETHIAGLLKNSGTFVKKGWKTNASGETFYYVKGDMLKGWHTIGGDTYYFGKKTGKLYKGWQKIGGDTYYFGKKTGKLYKGWQKIGGKRYYLGKSTGKLYTGIHKIKGNVYTFDENGVLLRTVYGNKKAICLTYDDGPSANTAVILNTLEKNGGLATFFVVGNRVKTYKKTVKRIDAMGCQIGNHSYSHDYYTRMTKKEIRQQIRKCNTAVKKAVKEKPVITRTPGGSVSDTIKKEVSMPVILWNVDTLDWKIRNADSVYAKVMQNAKDGNVILMHDLYASTAEASKRFIPKLAEQGFQLVTVEEMALLKGKKLKPGKVYYSFR